MKRILNCMLLAGSLAALSTFAFASEKSEKRELFINTVPVCSGKEDCEVKWEAAQIWVIHHAEYKIEVSNNVIIETYHPASISPDIGARVTKEPLGGGRYAILITILCANMFGCVPDELDAALDFNREVGSVSP